MGVIAIKPCTEPGITSQEGAVLIFPPVQTPPCPFRGLPPPTPPAHTSGLMSPGACWFSDLPAPGVGVGSLWQELPSPVTPTSLRPTWPAPPPGWVPSGQ